MNDDKFSSLGFIAQETGLPQAYLKGLADEKKIPALIVGSTYKFNLGEVVNSLKMLAAKDMGFDLNLMLQKEVKKIEDFTLSCIREKAEEIANEFAELIRTSAQQLK